MKKVLLFATILLTTWGCSSPAEIEIRETPNAVDYTITKVEDISVNRRKRVRLLVTAPTIQNREQAGDTAIRSALDFFNQNSGYQFIESNVLLNQHMTYPLEFKVATSEYSPDGKGVNPDSTPSEEMVLKTTALDEMPSDFLVKFLTEFAQQWKKYDVDNDGILSEDEEAKLNASINPEDKSTDTSPFFTLSTYQ